MTKNLMIGALGVAVLALSAITFTTSATAENLVNYKVVDHAIPQSLTGKPGDAERGRAVVIHRKKGGCLSCHVMPIPEQADHGLVGPDLAGVGSRLSEGEIRLRLVDPKQILPETMMPAFYRVEGLNRVAKKFVGQPMLSAQEVEDVVAYLVSLKD